MRPVGISIGIAILVLAAPVLAQSVWKWRDGDGILHYSDQPVPGAERIPLRARDCTPAAATTPPAQTASADAATPAYRNFEIWKPSSQSAVNGGQVSVGIRVEPRLARGHSLWLYLDGRRVDSTVPNATEYELRELAGGKHSLTALIADAEGQRVLTSEPVTFSIQP